MKLFRSFDEDTVRMESEKHIVEDVVAYASRRRTLALTIITQLNCRLGTSLLVCLWTPLGWFYHSAGGSVYNTHHNSMDQYGRRAGARRIVG